MPDGEQPVVEPTLESLHAFVKAQSTLLRELATTLAQLTARDRVVDGDEAHGSGSGQRIAGQPIGSGGAAERPDLLELAQSGRVGAKSVSDEDDYLAEDYLWMSCFGAHMAALFVALDELLPYVPAAIQDFTPYLARARNHAEAIDKAFRFRWPSSGDLMRSSVCTVTKVFWTCCEPNTFSLLLSIWRLRLHAAGADEDVVVDAGVAAKVSTSDGVGRLSSELVELCEATFR
eukprot:jgi/Tetstr1/442275/TSEL_030416.t1